MKKIITGALLLTGASIYADGKDVVKKEEVKTQDPVYIVIPRESKISVVGKKIYVKNDKATCSASRELTKETGGKVLKDVKCKISKKDPNYKFWNKVVSRKNIRVYDAGTQKEILKKIKQVEETEADAKTKLDDVYGASRLHFDMSIIKPANTPKENQNKKVVYVKKEELKMTSKKKDDVDVDKIIKTIAERIAKEN